MDAKDKARFINSVSSTVSQPLDLQADTRVQEDKRSVIQSEHEESVFASGLPDWDIIPPQVVVRRKRKI